MHELNVNFLLDFADYYLVENLVLSIFTVGLIIKDRL